MKFSILCIAVCLCAVTNMSCSHYYDRPTSSSGTAVALGDVPEDRSLYFTEAEKFKEKSGGDLDEKGGASQRNCLGSRWGDHVTDFVTYDIDLKEGTKSAVLVMRVAFEGTLPQFYDVLMDGKNVRRTELNPTGGYGYTEKEWKCFSIPIGPVAKGAHTLTIRPIRSGEIVNIDCLVIGKDR